MLSRLCFVVLVACAAGLWLLLTQPPQDSGQHRTDLTVAQSQENAQSQERSPLPLPSHGGLALGATTYDSNVKPASATVAVLAPLALGATAEPKLTITELQQGDLVWPVDNQVSRVLLASAPKAKVIGTIRNAPLDKYRLNVRVFFDSGTHKDTEVTNVAQADGRWEQEIDVPANAVRIVPVLKALPPSAGGTAVVPEELPFTSVEIAPSSSGVGTPTMLALSNNSLEFPTSNFGGSTQELPGINVYGGYLRLRGQNVLRGTQLKFVVFKQQPVSDSQPNARYVLLNAIEIPTKVIKHTDDGIWEVELSLPKGAILPAGNPAVLQVIAIKDAATHAFATNRLVFTNSAAPPPGLKIPAFHLTQAISAVEGANGTVNLIGNAYYSNRPLVKISGNIGDNSALPLDGKIAILLGDGREVLAPAAIQEDNKTWSADVKLPERRNNLVRVAWSFGNQVYDESEPIAVHVRTSEPKVDSVEPRNFASTPGVHQVTVTFDEELASLADVSTLNQKFKLIPATKDVTIEFDPQKAPELSLDKRSVILTFKPFSPDELTLKIEADAVADLFGNHFRKAETFVLVKPIGAELPTISPGITGPTGPYVPYGEYTNPRPFVNGFNPSDHVETRVSRLYYYRDAHRVAQIVNRHVRSYNRAAVDMQQQLADKARTIADQATDDRRAKEREAVKTAQQTREAERQLQQAEANARRASTEAAQANAQVQQKNQTLNDPAQGLSEAEKTRLNSDIKQATEARTAAEQVFETERRRANAAADQVQELRAREADSHEKWQASLAVEGRAREEQFRREVAAAHADPDTYAPGVPTSEDPVEQVSVSVIGEGVIQLRGPIKGINMIRTMINQIDAPVGQVRVGVHTVQINGEKGDRMEVVAANIQRYIDHSRFLTLQSAEMLRKAIVQVAAQRALECGNVPGLTQEARDRSYLYAFFGEDFIRELEAMDSEFLATGNKLLSIHSMDSTSLASAMFIMALAKNSTRMQILQTFEEMMASELPMAEQSYFEAGLTCDGKHKLFDKHCKREDFTLLAENARFQSIRGMFNVEIAEDDTMTPFQREFLRLAQIFKSRLIVELELKQRIMERSVIEERLGNRGAELREARDKEKYANKKLGEAQRSFVEAQKAALVAAQNIRAMLPTAKNKAEDAAASAERYAVLLQELFKAPIEQNPDQLMQEVSRVFDDRTYQKFKEYYESEKRSFLEASDVNPEDRFSIRLRNFLRNVVSKAIALNTDSDQEEANAQRLAEVQTDPLTLEGVWDGKPFTLKINLQNEVEGAEFFDSERNAAIGIAEGLDKTLSGFSYDELHAKHLEAAREILARIRMKRGNALDDLLHAPKMFRLYQSVAEHLVSQKLRAMIQDMDRITTGLSGDGADLNAIYQCWVQVDRQAANPDVLFGPAASNAFRQMLDAKVDYDFAQRQAEASRQPLDHKKFLDMLVDDMEDKYIELLEGTRAHTANIDAYIKRLMTSLDDDFNTQFYYPTFRKVREASQMWDVQLGQIETTNVLANNRAFAKVSPEATMEFDLPKRDILIAEAMNGAKAMIDDFGALAQDPTFLAMAQMRSGAPTSTPMAGATGGQATVRNVLPGLSTDTAEAVMAQQGPGGSTFGTAMEALIPDPAIYKFETGTGWEIRPVIQPDGQSLVFHFNYMYTTNVREPVRADEKHLGRVKRHYVDTDVQLSNYELREISRYTVALKASRTSRGVPLFEDVPVVGALFRPLPSDESSLQQNVILGQATIFPTVFDLMGLRWAPAVADLDPLRLSNDEFIVRSRRRAVMNRVFDHSSSKVDEFLRIPEAERRMDLYRSQETIPSMHPNGYEGPGANLRDSQLQEGYDPTRRPQSQFIPSESSEGSPLLRGQPLEQEPLYERPLERPKPGGPSNLDGSSLQGRGSSPDAVANLENQSRAPEVGVRIGDRKLPRPATQSSLSISDSVDWSQPASGSEQVPSTAAR